MMRESNRIIIPRRQVENTSSNTILQNAAQKISNIPVKVLLVNVRVVHVNEHLDTLGRSVLVVDTLMAVVDMVEQNVTTGQNSAVGVSERSEGSDVNLEVVGHAATRVDDIPARESRHFGRPGR